MICAYVQRVDIHRVPCRSPGDLDGVRELVDRGELNPANIVAVMGKTEGNGCVNDHTRDFATQSWCHYLSEHFQCKVTEVPQRVALVMSGGTEGVLSPHFTVFTQVWVPHTTSRAKRLVIGIAHTRDFLPEEIGRVAQIDATTQAVQVAMQKAGIADSADVHFVQIKCPLLTSGQVNEALRRGAKSVTQESYESMGFSRGASALGVAVALGEVARAELDDTDILSDWTKYSSCASASSGIELQNNVVIVLGEAAGSASPWGIAHTVMQDAVDATSIRRMFIDAFGLDTVRDASALSQRLANLFAKAEASPDGLIRGERHTMLNDSDINATRHARAVVGGVLASVVGCTSLYVSGGAEHQGPPGGGPISAMVRMPNKHDLENLGAPA